MPLSLKSRFMLLVTLISLACMLVLSLSLSWPFELALPVTLILLLVNVSLTHWLLRPVDQGLTALNSGLLNFKDGDFSTLIGYQHNDELGQLCQLYNQTAEKLRQDKQWIYQRELMLDKVLHHSPQALLLVNDNDQLVYSNQTARNWLFAGKRAEGSRLSEQLEHMPAAVAEALQSKRNGLFHLDNADGEPQTWYLATGQFLLNNQYHHLYVLKQLTREMNRQEVAVWKKVIRVVSHELNNSLAPISSMSHSGKLLAKQVDEPRLERVFNTIDDRMAHLTEFVQGYGKFAKLPEPTVQAIDWQQLLDKLRQQWQFELQGELPSEPGRADLTQLEQLLINLLKNAHESGSKPEHIQLGVEYQGQQQQISVSDKGKGMSEAVMSNALLPFYSTKHSGSGLGLALCREIVDAHQGQLTLHNLPEGGLLVQVSLPLVY